MKEMDGWKWFGYKCKQQTVELYLFFSIRKLFLPTHLTYASFRSTAPLAVHLHIQIEWVLKAVSPFNPIMQFNYICLKLN